MKLRLIIVMGTCAIGLSCACSMPRGWRPKPPSERIPQAPVVVYGKLQSIRQESKYGMQMNTYTFQVRCVLRNTGSTTPGRRLVVSEYSPPVCVYHGYGLRKGRKYVITLSSRDNTDFYLHDSNAQGAIFSSSEARAADVARWLGYPSPAHAGSRRVC